jgi:hypothetical protein
MLNQVFYGDFLTSQPQKILSSLNLYKSKGFLGTKFLFSALSHAHFSLYEWKTSNYDWQSVAVITYLYFSDLYYINNSYLTMIGKVSQ